MVAKETELFNNKNKSINNIMNTLSEGSEENSSSETHSAATTNKPINLKPNDLV